MTLFSAPQAESEELGGGFAAWTRAAGGNEACWGCGGRGFVEKVAFFYYLQKRVSIYFLLFFLM